MLTLEEAASVFGEDMPLVQRLTDSGAVHFTHDALGGLLICVNTLWTIWVNNPNGSGPNENHVS